MELFSLLAKLTLDSKDYEKELSDAQKQADNFTSPDDQTLDLDPSGFTGGLTDAEGAIPGFESNVTSAFSNIKNFIVGLGIAGAITGIVNGIKEAVDLTAETADGIDKGSKRLGISTRKYQEWDHALRQSGAGINDLQKGVMQFNKVLAGEGTEDVIDAFNQLKIDPTSFKDAESLVDATLMKLAELPDDADRYNLVTALFGKGGTSLNALLDEGTDGVKELLNEASELGLVMSDDEIKQAVEYGDSIANLNAELDAIKMAFVQDIIPVLTDASKWLTSILTLFNPRIRENSLSQTFDNIDKKTDASILKMQEYQETADSLVEKLASMGSYWTLDESGKKTWNALADELIKRYPELDEVIKNNKDIFWQNTAAIKANIDELTKLRQQQLIDQNIEDKQAAVAEKYAKALDKGIEADLKDAEAKGKKKTAIDQLNAVLAKNEELNTAVYGRFGTTTVTDENAAEIFKFAKEFGLPMGTEAVEEWYELTTEVEKLREEAAKMEAEADQAQIELTKYANALAVKLGLTTQETRNLREEIAALKAETVGGFQTPGVTQYTHATGAEYIPFDNYPALLHRGEKVLTATEARQERNSNIDISGLENAIVAAIQKGMEGVTVDSYLDGRKVTDEVSRTLAVDLAGRRFA